MKYFSPEAKPAPSSRQTASRSVEPIERERLIGLTFGSLVQSESYNWTTGDVGGWSLEASYMNAEEGYLAQGYHLEMQKFSADNQELTKLSFLFSLTFPRRLSFPVYLGVAVGPGFFMQQQEGESEFTIDYKAYLGLRLNQNHGQYFVQAGVKNHLHVLSDGQFIGWFVSSGVAYKF
jgi:hypothetical protein